MNAKTQPSRSSQLSTAAPSPLGHHPPADTAGRTGPRRRSQGTASSDTRPADERRERPRLPPGSPRPAAGPGSRRRHVRPPPCLPPSLPSSRPPSSRPAPARAAPRRPTCCRGPASRRAARLSAGRGATRVRRGRRRAALRAGPTRSASLVPCRAELGPRPPRAPRPRPHAVPARAGTGGDSGARRRRRAAGGKKTRAPAARAHIELTSPRHPPPPPPRAPVSWQRARALFALPPAGRAQAIGRGGCGRACPALLCPAVPCLALL